MSAPSRPHCRLSEIDLSKFLRIRQRNVAKTADVVNYFVKIGCVLLPVLSFDTSRVNFFLNILALEVFELFERRSGHGGEDLGGISIWQNRIWREVFVCHLTSIIQWRSRQLHTTLESDRKISFNFRSSAL
jgi:hypothetical protein